MWHDTGHAAQWVSPGLTVEPDEHVESPAAKRRIRNLLDVSGVLAQLTPIEPRGPRPSRSSSASTRRRTSSASARRATRRRRCRRVRAVRPRRVRDRLARSGRVPRRRRRRAGRHGRQRLRARAAAGPPCRAGARASARASSETSRSRRCTRGRHVGLERVAIVDWDVHHGNGTQLAFWTNPTVLAVSVHQDSFYPPDSGHVTETGEGDGAGLTVNIPLPPGSGVGAYVAAFERVVVPVLRDFEPELVLVASRVSMRAPSTRRAGCSSTATDIDNWRGSSSRRRRSSVTDASSFATRADTQPPTPPSAPSQSSRSSRASTRGVGDPFLEVFQGMAGQDLTPHQLAAIETVQRIHAL